MEKATDNLGSHGETFGETRTLQLGKHKLRLPCRQQLVLQDWHLHSLACCKSTRTNVAHLHGLDWLMVYSPMFQNILALM